MIRELVRHDKRVGKSGCIRDACETIKKKNDKNKLENKGKVYGKRKYT